MTAYITEGRAIAAKTADAYSFDRYGATEWRKAATALLARDWTAEQVEWTLLSKHTRWAADASDKPYGKATAKDLLDFIDGSPKHYGQQAVQKHIDDEG